MTNTKVLQEGLIQGFFNRVFGKTFPGDAAYLKYYQKNQEILYRIGTEPWNRGYFDKVIDNHVLIRKDYLSNPEVVIEKSLITIFPINLPKTPKDVRTEPAIWDKVVVRIKDQWERGYIYSLNENIATVVLMDKFVKVNQSGRFLEAVDFPLGRLVSITRGLYLGLSYYD